jgi:serine/threonine-protein phosphatase 4 regulatory subunit 2
MTTTQENTQFNQLEQELDKFTKTNENERQDNEQLNDIIHTVAIQGSNPFNWPQLKTLLQFKITLLGKVTNLNDEYTGIQQKLLQSLEARTNGPPFTLQRICEILYEPYRQYTKPERVILALQTCLNVPSSIDDFTRDAVGEDMEIDTL